MHCKPLEGGNGRSKSSGGGLLRSVSPFTTYLHSASRAVTSTDRLWQPSSSTALLKPSPRNPCSGSALLPCIHAFRDWNSKLCSKLERNEVGSPRSSFLERRPTIDPPVHNFGGMSILEHINTASLLWPGSYILSGSLGSHRDSKDTVLGSPSMDMAQPSCELGGDNTQLYTVKVFTHATLITILITSRYFPELHLNIYTTYAVISFCIFLYLLLSLVLLLQLGESLGNPLCRYWLYHSLLSVMTILVSVTLTFIVYGYHTSWTRRENYASEMVISWIILIFSDDPPPINTKQVFLVLIPALLCIRISLLRCTPPQIGNRGYSLGSVDLPGFDREFSSS
jgi:hypothetical protein